MAHVDIVLRPPSYGWADEQGKLVKPTTGQMLREFADRLNVLKSRKQWLPFTSWLNLLCMAPFLVIFAVYYFSWPLVVAGFLYSMILMGSHGTAWYHRFGTHKAFEFRHPIFRIITQNLVVKMVSEELYIVSHFVHHSKSDEPGDPYNPHAGGLYCFIADAIHQPIAHDLSEEDYAQAVGYMAHTGVPINTYEQYLTWGTITHPLKTWVHQVANWSFWFGAFYLIGGPGLACALLGSAMIWALGVRTFNYGAHGAGKDLRRDGEEFNRRDLSINQIWPGIVAGEWHNNHHLYPRSSRSGFKPWQIDLPYYFVRVLHKLGAISSYRDAREHFYKKHYQPYLDAQPGRSTEAEKQ